MIIYIETNPEAIRSARDSLGYSGKMAARKSGISDSYYRKIESGEYRFVTLEKAAAIAAAFQVNPDSIFPGFVAVAGHLGWKEIGMPSQGIGGRILIYVDVNREALKAARNTAGYSVRMLGRVSGVGEASEHLESGNNNHTSLENAEAIVSALHIEPETVFPGFTTAEKIKQESGILVLGRGGRLKDCARDSERGKVDYSVVADPAAIAEAIKHAGITTDAMLQKNSYSLIEAENIAKTLGVAPGILFPGFGNVAKRAKRAKSWRRTWVIPKKGTFKVSVDRIALKEARVAAGMDCEVLDYAAGVGCNFYRIEKQDGAKIPSSHAEAVAAVLKVEINRVFPDYFQEKSNYESEVRTRRKVSDTEKGALAERYMPLVEAFARDRCTFMRCDYDEALSILLVSFAECLEVWDGVRGFGALATTVLKRAVRSEVRRQRANMRRDFDTVSLDCPAFRDDGGSPCELFEITPSTYDLEEHVEAREELRLRLRYADDDTRRIILEELSL